MFTGGSILSPSADGWEETGKRAERAVTPGIVIAVDIDIFNLYNEP